MLPKPVDAFKASIGMLLCVIYSSWIGFGLLIAYIFKKDSKMWVKKDRPVAPEQLRNEEYGKHKFANVNGIKLHYVENGDKKNPLIVFVHGFPEFWYSWRYQLKEFSKDYWVIAIDQRGYNLSDKPQGIEEYRINKMSDDIHALVKTLGRDKFTIIGHDWGAAVGFNYVYRYMDTLDKYIMIGGPTSKAWEKLVLSSLKQFFMSWYVFFFQMPFLPELVLSLNDFKTFHAMKLDEKEDLECYKYTFSQPNALTAPINYYRAISILYPDPQLPRPKNCAPGLFMLGENDKYISRQTGKIIEKEFDNIEFKVIKGANHFAQQHKPELTNQMIREFLEKK